MREQVFYSDLRPLDCARGDNDCHFECSEAESRNLLWLLYIDLK